MNSVLSSWAEVQASVIELIQECVGRRGGMRGKSKAGGFSLSLYKHGGDLKLGKGKKGVLTMGSAKLLEQMGAKARPSVAGSSVAEDRSDVAESSSAAADREG